MPRGRTKDEAEVFQRVFNGMEIVDAKGDLIITVTPEDKIGAIPNDLENCVFAKTTMRLFGSRMMVFMLGVAYVDLECEDGIRRCNRFMISEKMKAAIIAYDESKGKVFEPGVYILSAPKHSQTLESYREFQRKRRKNPKLNEKIKAYHRAYGAERRAKIKAVAKALKTKKAIPFVKSKNRAAPLGVVRNGMGLIQTKVVAA